ncbi:M69 protein [Murid betaherpesvirus 1]|nr:M69 protein [Murid betaherpesvirus 1]
MLRTGVKRRLGPFAGYDEDETAAGGVSRRSKYSQQQSHHSYYGHTQSSYHGSGSSHPNWKRNAHLMPPPLSSPSSPPPQYDKNIAALTHLNKKLDCLGPDDLECLKAMIRIREARAQGRRPEPSSAPSILESSLVSANATSVSSGGGGDYHQQTSPDIRDYTTGSLGLCMFPMDLPDPIKLLENRYTDNDRHAPAVVTHDELINTNYLLLFRKHFDALPAEDLRVLVQDRTFAINNAPSLDVVAALADENLTYVKFHRVHNLPVNHRDLYMSTLGLVKYAVFNKLNLGELSCLLDGPGGGSNREYHILRQIANKPASPCRKGASSSSAAASFDVLRRSPLSFKHPLQQALALIASFARIVGVIRRRSLRHSGPFFIRDFDDTGATDSYRCGMISELIFDYLRSHRCQNEVCRVKLKKLLQPYTSTLFFCAFNNTRKHPNGTYRREGRHKRRAPDATPIIPRLAYRRSTTTSPELEPAPPSRATSSPRVDSRGGDRRGDSSNSSTHHHHHTRRARTRSTYNDNNSSSSSRQRSGTTDGRRSRRGSRRGDASRDSNGHHSSKSPSTVSSTTLPRADSAQSRKPRQSQQQPETTTSKESPKTVAMPPPPSSCSPSPASRERTRSKSPSSSPRPRDPPTDEPADAEERLTTAADEEDEGVRSPGECSVTTRRGSSADESSASSSSSSESSSSSDEEESDVEDCRELDLQSKRLEEALEERHEGDFEADDEEFVEPIEEDDLHCSLDMEEDIEDEPLDPETESVWTASVTPLTAPPSIRIIDHEPGDAEEEEESDTDFYDETDQPLNKRIHLRSATPTDDVIMECDLSYSEMDSD